MKGFVPTPNHIVDLMVQKLFRGKLPGRNSTILDPGCGTGAFIGGIIRWCCISREPFPQIVGVELDPRHIPEATQKFAEYDSVRIVQRDFLTRTNETYDYIIGNPPYVPIIELSEQERTRYRKQYATARGRFDLYLLFFEQALKCLKPGGRLVFITPEKFLYVDTAQPLRRILGTLCVEEIHLVDEETFGELITYPTITTVVNSWGPCLTTVLLRDGDTRKVSLTADGSSWIPILNGSHPSEKTHTLGDICLRVSCGVATGADAIYVVRTDQLHPNLKRFAYPTIAGRQLSPESSKPISKHSMLIPYTKEGVLLNEAELGDLAAYLSQPKHREKLLRRTCVARKPWYAFHENPPLPEILRPKILCKDITAKPFFVVDEAGELVPRHSIYYIVPKDPSYIHALAKYLNSPQVSSWLKSHCQRAANGFLRLQSRILKELPVPRELVPVSDYSQISLWTSKSLGVFR